MRRIFCSLLVIFLVTQANAQTATDSVKTAVDQLFAAMRHADSAALKDCFAPGATLQSVSTDKTGKEGIHTSTIDAFASAIGKLPADAADERITYGAVLIDGNLASVWTPYRFYFKQQFSHCGVNSFQLVKLESGWKIQYIIDTRRKDGCVEETAVK